MSTEKNKLAVLQGGSESIPPITTVGARRATTLQIVEAPHSPTPKQLELLPDLTQRDRLIVVRYAFLDFEAFRSIIMNERIQTVVDVRGSASFLGRGFSRAAVLDLLNRCGAIYIVRPAMSNPFIGQSWDRHALVRRYFEYLRGIPGEIAWLRDVIRRGPVLLIGDHRDFVGSEVGTLVDAVVRLDGTFKLEVR